MTIQCNVDTLAKNLQTVGKTMLSGLLFRKSVQMTRMNIFGCGSYGGYFGAPPMNIFHPYYSSMQGYNPYYMQPASNYSLAMANRMFLQCADRMYPPMSNPQNPTVDPIPHSTQNTNPSLNVNEFIADTEIAETMEDAIISDSDFKFVTDKWSEIDNKGDDITDAESESLKNGYNAAVSSAANSWISEVDKSHGNNDNELTLEEFTDYVKKIFLKDSASADETVELQTKAERAFERLDVDGNMTLTGSDIEIALNYLDMNENREINGNIKGSAISKFKEDLTAENDTISEKLRNLKA